MPVPHHTVPVHPEPPASDSSHRSQLPVASENPKGSIFFQVKIFFFFFFFLSVALASFAAGTHARAPGLRAGGRGDAAPGAAGRRVRVPGWRKGEGFGTGGRCCSAGAGAGAGAAAGAEPQLEPAAGGGEARPGQAGQRRAGGEMSVLPLPSPAARPKEAEVRQPKPSASPRPCPVWPEGCVPARCSPGSWALRGLCQRTATSQPKTARDRAAGAGG